MTSQAVDLTELVVAVEQLELGANAFEFHGGICGLLCARGPGAVDRWLRDSGVTIRPDVDAREQLLETLHCAEADVWRALNAASFDFDLVLPADEVEMNERVEALAAWCQGFVTGLGLGGVEDSQADESGHAEIDEIVADLAEISRVTLTDEDVGDLDRAGFDLAAVTEHVRVCVQLAFEVLLQPDEPSFEQAELATTH